MSDPTETAIRDFLLATRESQTDFLVQLVRTASDNPPGDCHRHAVLTAGLLEGFGLAVERHIVPQNKVRAHGLASLTNLVVRLRFGDGPTVALNVHGDAVPPGDGWTHDPYGAEIAEGWLYGRGAAVSKSDIAAYAFAMLALRQSGAALAGAVELHITYDEESGGELGPRLLLQERITKPDLAIGPGFSYAIVNAHDGCLHLEVEVTGRSAHAARPAGGIDALEAATAILAALYRERHRLGGTVSAQPGIGSPQLTVGLIRGGINTNVVPDRVVFRLDRRMIPEERAEAVEADLRRLIGAAMVGLPKAEITVRRILLARALTPLPGSERLTEVLARRAAEVMGEAVPVVGMPLYTDARHYAEAGIPIVLYGAGPRSIEEANAHRADERVPLADLYRATEVIALALLDLLRA
jgi:acetylornithine deacetylase/succinyl-diaminopimelate desuccinylase-like protein